MKMGVTEPDELDMLTRHLPQLFCPRFGSNMLYVGANQLRPPHHARTLVNAGWRLHLLEVFVDNIAYHVKTNAPFTTYLHGDVRDVDLPTWPFDAVFWWHGCEHIPKADLEPTLARLEDITNLVVLGCPNGYSPQDTVYGNDAERHQWSVLPRDLVQCGYEVVAYDCVGRHHLLAWKQL